MVSWNFQGLLPYFLSPTFPLGSSFSHTHHTLNNASQELRVCGCVKPQVPGSTPRNRGRGHQSLGTSISAWPSNRGLSWVTVTEIMNSILNCRLGPTTPLEGTGWGGHQGRECGPTLETLLSWSRPMLILQGLICLLPCCLQAQRKQSVDTQRVVLFYC